MKSSRLPVFEAALRREAYITLCWGSAILLSGFAISIFLTPQISAARWFFHLCAATLFIAGLYLIVSAIKNYKHNALLKSVTQGSSEICWVYYQIVQSMPFGFSTISQVTIHLHHIDGSSDCVRISSKFAEQALEELKSVLLDATFGHSPEKEQLYRADPRLLLRSD